MTRSLDHQHVSTHRLDFQHVSAHRLLRWGMALFLIGLLTGFVIPALANPRMALTSHLEGLMNGTFLVVLGLVWTRLRVSERTLRIGFWLALFGAYANWATTLAAAALGAGGTMMPLAAGEHIGSRLTETLIAAGLLSLALAMVALLGIVLWGLRGGPVARPEEVRLQAEEVLV
jgi:(hydroxyamino)benzene mutase